MDERLNWVVMKVKKSMLNIVGVKKRDSAKLSPLPTPNTHTHTSTESSGD